MKLKKSGYLMDVEMVLIDGMLNNFNHFWKEEALYELRVFNVTRCNPSFRFGDPHVAITFRDEIMFVETAETINPVPTESFRFWHYDQLMLLVNTNTDLLCLF
ncbi:unnamed protein product [Eruca vesicaria subsp. sativa]|uniref:Uncharacterized protein n=1 Tax=Eruca vesicaria subsp. sativa TaxID=29727 RepID=A0ABC8LB05_ERUVS|nr:unnamed protein product [Eruca vesicaria subsp. sativa]